MPAAGQFPLALMVLTLGASALLAGPAAAEIVKISVADLSRADLTDAKNLNQSRLDQACGMDGDKANSIAHYKDAANVAAAVGRMSRRLLISGHDHLVAMLNRLKLRDQLDSLIVMGGRCAR